MKSFFVIIIDSVFFSIATLVLCFCIFVSLGVNVYIAVASGLIAALLLFFALYFKSSQKLKNANLKLSEKQALEKYYFMLSSLADDKITELFSELLYEQNILAKPQNRAVLFDEKIFVLAFYPDRVDANAISEYIRLYGANNLFILSVAFTESAFNYAKQNSVTLLDSSAINEFILEKALSVELPKLKKRIFSNLQSIFTKASGRKFIVYGLVLEIMSFIVFFPIYYIISGAVFIVYGVIALLFASSTSTSKTTINSIISKQ